MPEWVQERTRRFLERLWIAYLTVVLYLTLFTYNHYVYGRSFNLVIFESIKLMAKSGSLTLICKNIFGNIGLFIPFGVLCPLLYIKYRSLFKCFSSALLASTLIEICQYLFAKRIFDVDDILLNVVGAISGWGIFKIGYWLAQLLFGAWRLAGTYTFGNRSNKNKL